MNPMPALSATLTSILGSAALVFIVYSIELLTTGSPALALFTSAFIGLTFAVILTMTVIWRTVLRVTHEQHNEPSPANPNEDTHGTTP
jgi:hypothetical protein